MTGGPTALLSRRLLSVDNFTEAINHEQDRLLTAVKRDEMIAEVQFLHEDWQVAVVVGDPGLGKSWLLEELSKRIPSDDTKIQLQLLKFGFNRDSLSHVISEQTQSTHFLLLFDGFDELTSSQIVPFHSALSDLLSKNPRARVVISSRTTFAQRYEGILASLKPKIYLLDRFSQDEITQYMQGAGVRTPIVELASEWFHLQRGTNIISVPRYLKYVCEYLNDPSSNIEDKLPRLHLVFQSVVKRALKQQVSIEDMITDPWITERVLAKLALVMEVAQVNSITHDELLTFFDTASSDLKTYFLTPETFTVLSERLLKFDGVSCSFLDREIQEFLASTEIARLPEPLRAVYTLCFDEHARILKPSWFNTLRFLFDRMPRIFADVVQFLLSASSIDGITLYTLDESFWNTAPRFRVQEMPKEAERILFTRTVEYFRASKFWLDYEAVNCLASVYTDELESLIRNWISEVDQLEGSVRVEQSNIARLIGELRAQHPQIVPEEEWKQWLLKIACDVKSDLVAVRTILWALRHFPDSSIIEKVSVLTERNDQFINEALARVCADINPEHPTAIALLTKLVKGGVAGSFRALMSVRANSVLAAIFKDISEDGDLLGAILNELSYRSANKESALNTLFSGKIEDPQLSTSVRQLVSAMILRIGHSHKHEEEVFDLCQRFSSNNEELLWASVRDVVQNSAQEHDWNLSSGFAYFLTTENQGGIIQKIRSEFPNRFDDYFFTLLQGEVTRKHTTNQLKTRKKVKSGTVSEKTSLPTELVSRLRAFQTKEDFRVVVELSQLLEEFARTGKVLEDTEKEEVSKFIVDSVFTRFDPSAGSISLNKDVSHRSWRISNFLGIFGLGVQIFKSLGESKQAFRDKLLEYLPFATQDEKGWLREQVGVLNKIESDKLCQSFINNEALKKIKLENLLEISKQLHHASIQNYFPTLAIDPVIESYERRQLISSIVDGKATATLLSELKGQLKSTDDLKTIEHIDNILIERFGCRITARERAAALISKAGIVPKRHGGQAFSPSPLESEMWEKEFAAPLLRVSDPSWSDIYFELLAAGFLLASKGENLVTYADYLWEVVFKFTENLIAHRSYQPFIELERKIAKHFDLEGANWVQGKLAKLRNTYSMALGKPSSFIAATLLYNSCLNALVSPVEHSRELLQMANDTLKNEVGPWLVGAGRKLVDTAYKTKSKQREVSIQRVMRGPLLEALNHKRHINYSFNVIREPQIDDDRRTDLIISYGFVGPCVIELKLSSHDDLNSRSIQRTKSFSNLKTYMNGYRSNAGILVVLEDKKLSPEKRKSIADAFAGIVGIRTLFLDLPVQMASSTKKKPTKSKKAPTKVKPSSKVTRKAVRSGKSARAKR